MTMLSKVEMLDDDVVDEALDRAGARIIATIGCLGREEGK